MQLDHQQKLVMDMFNEVDWTNQEVIDKEIERLSVQPDAVESTFLRYIFPSIIDSKHNASLDYTYQFPKIAADNIASVINGIKSGSGHMLPLLSYAYIQTKLKLIYKDKTIDSIFQPRFSAVPVTEEQILEATAKKLQAMVKERLKVDSIIELDRLTCKVTIRAFGKDLTRTFKVCVATQSLSDTFIECMFIHMCYNLKYDIINGLVDVPNEKLKEFVMNLLDVYATTYL